jgi:hypothetical protein
MNEFLLDELEKISKRESSALKASGASAHDIYAKSGRFIIERRHMASLSIGIPTSSVCIRTHLIGSDFPAHTRFYRAYVRLQGQDKPRYRQFGDYS